MIIVLLKGFDFNFIEGVFIMICYVEKKKEKYCLNS